MLMGTYFAFHHPTVATHVHTFGQPRSGNLGFKILLESIRNLNVWRMVNQQDFTIRRPFDKYYHAGHLLWRRKIEIRPDELSDQDFAYQAFYRTVGNPQLGLAGVDDFAIARKSNVYYTANINTAHSLLCFGRVCIIGISPIIFDTVTAPGTLLDLHDHLLKGGFIEWLETAVTYPESGNFPQEFERLDDSIQ